MIIGLAQMDIVWEDKTANYRKAEQFLRDAKQKSIELLLFPEMSMTGFSMNIEKIAEATEDVKTLAFFTKLAKEYKIAVGIGYVEKAEEKAFNKYAIINTAGEVLLDYAKIHPFSFGEESSYYRSGNTIKWCQLYDFQVSSFICYDLRFPEVFQIASKKAELITIAANWPKERREHWLTLCRARAIENQCYLAVVNRVGDGNGLSYSGDSVIISPYGEIISELSSKEGIIMAEIEHNTVLTYREEFKVKQDRKEELYKKWYAC